jgi:hypothetical protein
MLRRSSLGDALRRCGVGDAAYAYVRLFAASISEGFVRAPNSPSCDCAGVRP